MSCNKERVMHRLQATKSPGRRTARRVRLRVMGITRKWCDMSDKPRVDPGKEFGAMDEMLRLGEATQMKQ
jgi:hypothetical protein